MYALLNVLSLSGKVVEKHFSWDGQTLSSDLIEWKLPGTGWGDELGVLGESPTTELGQFMIYVWNMGKNNYLENISIFLTKYFDDGVAAEMQNRNFEQAKGIPVDDEWFTSYNSVNGYNVDVIAQSLKGWWVVRILINDNDKLTCEISPSASTHKLTIDEIKSYTAGFKFKSSTTSNPVTPTTPTNPVTPTTPVTLESSMSSSEVSGMNGWYNSSWFGYYWKDSDTNWIYHYKLGWLYTHVVEDGSLWFYHAITDSWLWTSSEHFPLVYSKATTKSPSFISLQQWLHFDFNDDSVQAFDETDKEWYGKDYLKANYLEAYK